MSEERKQPFPYIFEMLIMLAPCAVTACFLNGLSVLKLIIVCVGVSVVTDGAGTLLLRKELTLKDLSAVVTGLCIAMMLPASCPAGMAALASFLAVAAGKLPFGDYRKTPFVPAAVGIAFMTVVYPDVLFAYPVSSSSVTASSLASMLQRGTSVNVTVPGLLGILAGNSPGAAGCTCAFLFIACLVYLAIRHFPKFMTAAGFVAVCALFSLIFPRVFSGGAVSLVMELGGGMLLFTAVFLMPYPNAETDSVPMSLAYGAAGGILCMLIRYFGTFEEGACFAVLILNALSPLFMKKKTAFPYGGDADA